MLTNVVILHLDGSKEFTKEDIPEETESISFTATQEDRLSALESAMLSMMGVNTDV